jgi:predicted GNAT family N-acyltransferase
MIHVDLVNRESQDYEFCLDIRKKVFVIGQNVPLEDEVDEFEVFANHYLALFDGKPAGAARWRHVDDDYIKLERFAVLEEYRGKGIGSALVDKILDDIKKQYMPNIPLLILHSQVDAIPLYLKFNFEEEGEIFDECGILHRKMSLQL